MWNIRRDFPDSKSGDGQVGNSEPPAADNSADANISQEDGALPPTDNLTGSAAETELSRAYAALLKDNEAFRARLEREKTQVINAEKATIAQTLLDSTDDLERALAAVADMNVVQNPILRDLTHGVRLSLAVMYKRIAEMGAERLSTTGQRFDPRFAEAVNTITVTDPAQDGIVIQEIRAGYRVGDRLLRPAQVRVGRLMRR